MNQNLMNTIARSGALKRMSPTAFSLGASIKHISPELYLAGAIIAGVTAAVLAARAYKKHDEVMGDVVEEINAVHDHIWCVEDSEEGYTRQEAVKELTPLYAEAIKRGVRLYAPPLAMGVISVGLVLASHGIMRGRNQALFATLQFVEQGFREYRKRVVAEVGSDADDRYMYGTTQRTIINSEVGEDGKRIKTKDSRPAIGEAPNPLMYSRIFDESNPNFKSNPEMNRYFLEANQTWMNDQFQIRGYLLLNDVYEQLGFDRTTEGCVVGWSKKMPGDDRVDFGLDKPLNRVDPSSGRFIIDPNVHGVMFTHI